MSYLVLARKWRPQHFKELLGQNHICQTLQNAIKQNRIAHAFLFFGPRGVGKTSAARILAKTLICPQKKETVPCNQCTFCDEISKGISIDVIEIDGASNNGVDSIRELREKAHYLPTQGQTKIYIIDEVHMLSQTAFNALLKTLEEPPPHLKFIFATTEVHKIPATILSRCQRFDFKKIPLKQLQEHLSVIAKKEKIEIEENALLKISKEAHGSFRDALSLLDQVSTYSEGKITLHDLQEILGSTQDEVLLDLLEKIFKKDSSSALALLSSIYNKGLDVKPLSSDLLERLRSLLLLKITSFEKNDSLVLETFFDMTDHEFSRLKKLADFVSLEEIEYAFQIMLAACQEISQTLYPQFVFESTFIKLLQLRPLIPIETLLKKVEALQELLGGEFQAMPLQHSSKQKKDWHTVIHHIRTKKPSLAALLEHGYLIQFSEDQITIGFSKNSVFYKLLSEKENKFTFETIASEYLKTKISLTLVEITSEKDTGLTTLAKENENEISNLKKKALEHSMIQEAQKLFDGKIIDVKVTPLKKEPKHG